MSIVPQIAILVEKRYLDAQHSLFRFVFDDGDRRKSFSFSPGQFVMLSIFGVGEAPISITSGPDEKGFIDLCVRKAGRVTGVLHGLEENSRVGIRGPYGNGYPVEVMEGGNLLIVAGGLGIAPLRSLIRYVLYRRERFGEVGIGYGARDPESVLFYGEMQNLLARTDIKCMLSVDSVPENSRWQGHVGRVTQLLDKITMPLEGTSVAVCGPPVFYKFVLDKLLRLGYSKGSIYMSLERRMECGLGKCGHCVVGHKYTCIDGPIFTYWDAINLPEIF
ncbi:Heterodisulfide reductase, cytochrome reductase subunit [hydrothermal vent metagenome]|uniref:Heterodisulfide reductase, cytochrome reductase subunit n=1 Tax=hydrothermal vent metagenome TaxID=652676 RepID=A0A3B1D527_9ZZZZ